MAEINNNPFNEASLEKAVVELFENVGYTYQKADKIHRLNTDIILKDELEDYIRRRYADKKLTETEVSTIVNRVIDCGSHASLYENSKEAYELITGRSSEFKREDDTVPDFNVEYIDFENINNNTFKVVNQYVVDGKNQTRIPDLLVFINGIPVAIWEFKSALKEDKTIHDAWEQINSRYARDIDNLLRFCFLSVISDGANTKLGSTMSKYEDYHIWSRISDEDNEDDEIHGLKSLETMIKGVFSPQRIVEILRDFIFFPETTQSDAAPIVCRCPQFFGARLMAKNIVEHLQIGDGKGGTYFGAMGCGKTYTMLFITQLLKRRYSEITNDPTILIVEDRDDLDEQTIGVFGTATKFLQDADVRSFDSREDLKQTLQLKSKENNGGGVYITTIQKFCVDHGLLSERHNIICISDEAHRTQLNLEKKQKVHGDEIITTTGFGRILRDSLPNAVYCGFTGTPISETIMVFGDVVDKYTMASSVRDGITVNITYTSRLANLELDTNTLNNIDKYYEWCLEEGSTKEQVEASKRAMANISAIYSNPSVLKALASDIVNHYELICSEKPEVIQKAMIVCADRTLAYNIYNEIKLLRPKWVIPKKADDETKCAKEELSELPIVPKLNLVITREPNDPKDMYDLAGTRESRIQLAKNFKQEKSNFKIAIVSDMWITGFDVKPLTALYLVKPVQKHQLIQTISRVNRVWEGKDYGLVVDYMKLRDKLDEALKMYADPKDFSTIDIDRVVDLFHSQFDKVSLLMSGFDFTRYFNLASSNLERLSCLDDAANYVQRTKENQDEFMDVVLELKRYYNTAITSNELTDDEIGLANFYMAIRSIVYKETKGDAPDTEVMNATVEKMVQDAIICTGVDSVFEDKDVISLFNTDNIEKIKEMDNTITKVNALMKVVRSALSSYESINIVKTMEFSTMLEKIIEDYNRRNEAISSSKKLDSSTTITIEIVNRLYDILEGIKKDNEEFKGLGVSREEKAYYDILVSTKNRYNLSVSDDTCLEIAKQIKLILDEETKYTDWATRSDIKSGINKKITLLLSKYDFSLEYKEELFNIVIEQAIKMSLYKNNN